MKSRLIKTKTVVGLLVLLSVIGTLEARGRKGQSDKKGVAWMSELNLNQQQMQKINQLRNEMQPAIMDIRQKTRSMELELDRLNQSGQADPQKVAMLKQSISGNIQSISALQQGHREQIRVLLTPDQQASFDLRGNRMMASNKVGNSRGKNGLHSNGQCRGRWSRG